MAGVIALALATIPWESAYACTVAALRLTPRFWIGSYSPTSAEQIASRASVGEALLKLAKSDASRTIDVDMSAARVCARPIDTNRLPIVAAAPMACSRDCPSERAAVSPSASTDDAASPKTTFAFETVSDRSEAAVIEPTKARPMPIAAMPALTCRAMPDPNERHRDPPDVRCTPRLSGSPASSPARRPPSDSSRRNCSRSRSVLICAGMSTGASRPSSRVSRPANPSVWGRTST